MKYAILAIASMLYSFSCRAQKDSVLINELYNGTRSEAIAKARTVLLDKFIEKDLRHVKVVKDYLTGMQDEHYLTLYPQELLLLSYWTHEYEDVLSFVKEAVPGNGALPGEIAVTADSRKTTPIPPKADYLAIRLAEQTRQDTDSLVAGIRRTSHTNEEKDFLALFLQYLVSTAYGPANNEQQSLNDGADALLNRYPSGSYNTFTRQYIRVRYAPADNGYAISLHSGKFLFTGNLRDYYTHPTLAGLSIDFFDRKWIYQLDLICGFNKSKKDMPVGSAIWPGGSKATSGDVHLAAGRYLVSNRVAAIAPYAGIGIFGLDGNYNVNTHPEYKGTGIKTTISGVLGVFADLKLKTAAAASYFTNSPGMMQTTFLRFSYGYIATPLKNNFVDYSGAVHRITVGIGIKGSSKKRVY
ncbi:hypothetical protein [Niabella aurantiaca]|uniref:hypothetical protein n=1 Tax=Niabella aurantiaca TaxID=379900 RepID=UPI0003776FF0|nr:hypothetical protein [Niabella aurantiaca]